ncbi:MAG: hypothetical protein M1514_02480 [Patescibacteria group bacterium]|nr:hypothetical protein [Patescibacteria group bacterium]
MQNNKKYWLLTLLYGSLTILLLFLIFKFGISAAVKISELLQNKKPLPSSSLDNIALPAPQLYPIPEATNSATLPISGYSIANEKVDIYLNDLNLKTLDTDSEGKFEGTITLAVLENAIYAIARDAKDKQSPASQTWHVFYNDEPPYLQVTDPPNNSLVKKNPNVEFKGKVNITSKITINDHVVVLDNEGNFIYPVKLNSGENKFKIICSDPAQNVNEAEWTLNFQP